MTSSFVTALDRERRVRIMFHMSLFGPILTVKGGIGLFRCKCMTTAPDCERRVRDIFIRKYGKIYSH
jgi:hypothetical protein